MEKIAVVGLACLFPGAGTPEEFWRNLREGKDSTSTATDDKMGIPVRDYYDPRKGKTDRIYCVRGGYVHDLRMDPAGFRVPPERIEKADDVVRWPLYVAREALKDAGYWGDEAALSGCGVILGNLSFPTKSSNRLFLPIYHRTVESCLRRLLDDEELRLVPFCPVESTSHDDGRISGYPSAVIAEALSLPGPHFSLDAACASSLYAVKLACDYLLARKADLMLAGAVSAADPLFVHVGFSIFQAYPEEGRSSCPLDRRSGGLVAGEGAGMLVLKRYDDAQRDGDRIHAVILGIGLSNDGRGQSVLSPNPKGQVLAFERAYASAGIDPASVQYVECHATGTPLGDRVELDSMDSFFGRHKASPLVGSVKSNLGHLLTAAGMASMIKTILAMTRGEIPPTIHLEDPVSSRNQVISPERIPRSCTAWPRGQGPRRAGVSGFGFGGTDAHVILELAENNTADGAGRVDRDPPAGASTGRAAPAQRMAIVGMDAHFGTCEGLPAFHRTTYAGTQHFIPLPRERWKGIEDQYHLLKDYGFEQGKAPDGAYIESFDLDFLRFKIPPNEDDRLIPQQLLALKVADSALRETNVKPGGNVAVIIAMETEQALHQMRGRVNLCSQWKETCSRHDLSLTGEHQKQLEEILKDSVHNMARVNQYTSFIGNIMASRIASLWDFSGPAFTVSSEENSVFKALEVAQMMLATREVDAVVVGAVDLAGGVESVLWRNRRARTHAGRATLGFDRTSKGWLVGEGAGAVVLERLEDAAEADQRIYAVIDAVGIAAGTTPGAVAEACRRAFETAGLEPEAIGYVEASASGLPGEDEAEAQGLVRAYKAAGRGPRCALGSVKANIGHTFAASGMAGLIKAALCLYHRYIPTVPNWSAPKDLAEWDESPFYVPTESRTWFLGEGAGRRIAAVNGLGGDGSSAHVILSEGPDQKPRANDYLVETPPFLVPLAGEDAGELGKALDGLREQILARDSLQAVLLDRLEQFQRRARCRYALCLVGDGKEELIQEIDAARAGLEKAFSRREAWCSLRGSYLSPNPLGSGGKIAFVYPGGYNSYPGLGRDLFQLFPQMYEQACRYTSRLGSMLGERLLYPRSLHRLSERELNACEKELLDRPITMFESGILFAILYTRIMRECFRIEPRIALGYSMGEVSMMYALGVWDRTDEMSEALRTSPVFRTRLAGPMESVRQAWNLPRAGHENEKIWYAYVLRTSAERARKVLGKQDRAYLIFVNAPSEVVIAGEERACRQAIAELGCEHVEISLGDAIHCEIARLEYEELRRLHRLPVHPVSGIDFYSADRLEPIPIDADVIADNIATIYCREIDFPSLIARAYEDGARIFVEVGPRENCTNWIGQILSGRDHLAVAVNRKGADDKTSIVRALARLCSHGVDVDLSPLLQRSRPGKPAGKSLVRSNILGGTRIDSAILSNENRERFRPVRAQPLPRAPARGRAEARPRLPAREASSNVQREPGHDIPATPGMAHSRQQAVAVPPGANRLLPAFMQLSHDLSVLNSAHGAFLDGRADGLRQLGQLIRLQIDLAGRGGGTPAAREPSRPSLAAAAAQAAPPLPGTAPAERVRPMTSSSRPEGVPAAEPKGTRTLEELLELSPPPARAAAERTKPPGVIWDYEDLREFAEGEIANVFGDRYRIIDTYRRRVRLPMEPYLLVTRVTRLDAETGVFRPSSITTEYDIPYDAWYSVDGQIPWAVSVESGQCDLLLISYLGIDFECKGDRVYRLLDCTLTFLEDVPQEGDTLRYDIKINSFARTGGTLLFFFSYDCFVKDRMVIQMRGGCAGFFTDEELEAGKGIIRTQEELEERQRIRKRHFEPLLTCSKSRFERSDLTALARDDVAGCFGPGYDHGERNPSLHFTAEPMLMLDRIVSIDPEGGPWGLGLVVAEKDLAPDHWYFPCHFKDDPVLAGSLMADGCGQLMRFYMLYLGLQACTRDARFQPLPNLPQKVRCRGQVTPRDTLLTYRMEVKEIGTKPSPYAIADVDILLGEKVVVDFKNLGVLLRENPERDSARQGHGKLYPVPRPRSKDKEPLFTKKQLEEFATGSIARCFGPDFAIYEDRRPPRTPNGALQLIDRVLEVTGERLNMKRPARVVAEYDVPEDAWFYKENSHPALMPYSILMEISLQPCGFISAYVGTTLMAPDVDFCFRNLDGEGTILRDIDLRGKTVTNRSELLSTVMTGNTILQQFRFELSHDGDPFYKGTAGFGYFLPRALTNQIGLDGGVDNHPLTTMKYLSGPGVVEIDLKYAAARERYYREGPGKPHYRLAGPQLDFLDEVRIVEQGGEHGRGYIYGGKRIDPTDWFYPCHFYQDPVMPGSLGVESILQAMQVFALHRDLGARFKSPRFAQRLHHRIVWKYRGQLVPTDETMAIEVHIKAIEETPERTTIVGDASLWKNRIRIYAVSDVAICLEESSDA